MFCDKLNTTILHCSDKTIHKGWQSERGVNSLNSQRVSHGRFNAGATIWTAYPVANKKIVGIISLYSNYPVGIMGFGPFWGAYFITNRLAMV